MPSTNPANHPPLVALAFHIFSICPNSASCERLFSSFGNILTKSRTRLHTDTLSNLAELKMHLRDERLRSGTSRQRAKRHLDTLRQGSRSTSILPSTSQLLSSQQSVEQPEEEEDGPEEQNRGHSDAQAMDTGTAGAPLFSQLARQMVDMIDADSADDAPAPLPARSQTFNPLSIPLGELFNFSASYWTQSYHVMGQGLREEALLHEVVEGIIEESGALPEDVERADVE